MHRDRRDRDERLASLFDSHELGRRLRDVPPYEVYYVESLFVQNQHDADETAARARAVRERVFDRVDRLDGR